MPGNPVSVISRSLCDIISIFLVNYQHNSSSGRLYDFDYNSLEYKGVDVRSIWRAAWGDVVNGWIHAFRISSNVQLGARRSLQSLEPMISLNRFIVSLTGSSSVSALSGFASLHLITELELFHPASACSSVDSSSNKKGPGLPSARGGAEGTPFRSHCVRWKEVSVNRDRVSGTGQGSGSCS